MLVAFLVPGAAHALAGSPSSRRAGSSRPRSPELTRDRPAGCIGNVLEPYLFGKTLDLSPVVILCSLMVWAALWGITGMVHLPRR